MTFEAWRQRADAPVAAGLDVGLVRPVLAGTALAVLVGLFVVAERVREAEAALSALVARTVGGVHDAHRVGSSVLFDVDGRLTGYTLTLGCTVAFLVVPFFAATAGLLVVRRVPVHRAVGALAAAVAVVLVVNQVRMAVIGAAMSAFGAATGYSLTHVLVGTLISTLGVVGAGAAYLVVLVRGSGPAGGEVPGA